MRERIAIRFLREDDAHWTRFIIHEQPQAWVDGMMITCNILGLTYCIRCATHPRITLSACFLPGHSDISSLSFPVGLHFSHDHDILAMRYAITALVNVARAHGYDFALIP